jgi:leader peptidase (prepilin peptidase)/N-methyltransferase
MYLIYILFFIIGLFCGSLVNYMGGGVTREPRSFIFSSCRECTAGWQWLYMVPILGFILTRGRCPQCGKSLGLHMILVEIGCGVLFTLLVWRFGLTWELSLAAIYCLVLLILLVTDLEKMLLPNVITYPGFIIVFVLSVAVMALNFEPRWAFHIPATGFFSLLNNYLVSALLGALTGFILLLLVAVVSRGGMALGDVKLAGLIGLMTGFPNIFVALFVGIIGGGLIAGLLLLSRLRKRKDPMPFGPFLCLGGMVALLWGTEILKWYLSPLSTP